MRNERHGSDGQSRATSGFSKAGVARQHYCLLTGNFCGARLSARSASARVRGTPAAVDVPVNRKSLFHGVGIHYRTNLRHPPLLI